ncbi:MAG: HlyD family efflux transporter periplasmic adaptor subunit [Alphaproteobacteria bacterium]|nr:HlyD family efflux transporter periplasmic adaptor subunit [Alphaproteobacteria bacterium]
MPALIRTGFGLAIGGIAFALVLAAGGVIYQAYEAGGVSSSAARAPKEKAYSVEVGTLISETLTPVITSYGHLVSGRTLELRSAVAGPLIELSDNFRDGGAVAAGEVLFRIDPARLESALSFAEADVAESVADLAEAKAGLELARLEANAAQSQFDLRDQAVARQEDLRARGVSTSADVEAATLARAAAEQSLINRRQVVAADEARVAQAEITVERRKTALGDARRALADATVTAPFAGVISAPDAVAGRLVSANEMLGTLIDPTALEVSFRVTNMQFARLIDDAGLMRKSEVTVLISSGRNTSEIPAILERAGAEVGDGQIGRLVYARLIAPDAKLVRPGDFVTVHVPERPLSDVAQIPTAAATSDGLILLIGDGNRLEEFQATPVRNQGDTLIVGDVPFGRQYVLTRALQLGAGIQVAPIAAAKAVATPTSDSAVNDAAPAAAAPTLAPAATPAASETIALDDARRTAIVDFIKASTSMKPEMREKFLEELSRPDVPLETVSKFESKMVGAQ